jgi:small subunit ribosomal protein S18
VKSDRRAVPKRRVNILKREGIEAVDWKDPTLLRKFVSDRGKIRSRRVTGLTPQQQKQVATAIKNAREMALLAYPSKGK